MLRGGSCVAAGKGFFSLHSLVGKIFAKGKWTLCDSSCISVAPKNVISCDYTTVQQHHWFARNCVCLPFTYYSEGQLNGKSCLRSWFSIMNCCTDLYTHKIVCLCQFTFLVHVPGSRSWFAFLVHACICVRICIHIRFQVQMAPTPFSAALVPAGELSRMG